MLDTMHRSLSVTHVIAWLLTKVVPVVDPRIHSLACRQKELGSDEGQSNRPLLTNLRRMHMTGISDNDYTMVGQVMRCHLLPN
jgi:hypothetical protein